MLILTVDKNKRRDFKGNQSRFTLISILVCFQGGGCGLMARTNKFEQIVRGMNSVSSL